MLTREQWQHRLNLELHQVQESPDLNLADKETFLRDIFRSIDAIKGEMQNETT